MIVEGAVLPRQRLSHRNLSRDLGIGRSPVRDALLQLEAEGLIEHRPSSGIYLREITHRELECLCELRIVNEPYAAEKAAQFAEARHIAVLRRICDEMTAIAKKADKAAWFASVNPIAVKLFGNAQLLVMTFAWDLCHGKPEWFAEIVERTAAGHRAVFDAIRARDPAAARKKMLDHVGWAQLEIPEHYAAMREADPARSK